MSRSDAIKDRAEGSRLQLSVRDQVGHKERIIDGEGDIPSEDLIVVLKRRGTKDLDIVAVEYLQDAIHLLAHIFFGRIDPEAHRLIALRIVGFRERGDATETIGEAEDDGT